MLKWFTNAFGKQVAIDSRHVTSVYETNDDANKLTIVTTLNGNIQVKDSILEVVSRLNAD